MTIVVIMIMLSVFTVVSGAYGADRHVQKTGSSDGNNCTVGSPCLTIGRGLQVLQSSETLYIHAGTYEEQELTVNQSGSAGAHTTITNFSSDVVNIVWTGAYTDNHNTFTIVSGTDYVTINGLVLNLYTASQDRGVGYAINGANNNNNHNITVSNSEIFGCGASCFLTSGSNWIIENNYIHDCGTVDDLDHCIYHSGDNAIIRGNTVARGHGYNMQQYPFGSDGVVTGNVWTDSSLGFTFTITNNQTFSNNIMHSDGSDGLGFRCFDSDNVKVYNNTFYASSLFFRDDCNGSHEIRNNIFAGGAVIIDDTGGNITSSNNYNGDPGFVSVGGGNFHITAEATGVIDQGSTIGSVTVDIDGDSRVSGLYDIGADEFVAGNPEPQHLAYDVGESNVIVNQAMVPAVVLHVHYPDHSIVTSSTVLITLTHAGGCGNMTCGVGTCAQNAVAGVVTFDDLRFDAVGTGCTLNAHAVLPGGEDNEVSTPFDVLASSGPVFTGLAFVVQPSHVHVNLPMVVQVRAVDEEGVTYVAGSVSISLELEDNAPGAVLSGGGAVGTVSGVATFSAVSVNKGGVGYTLRAVAAGVSNVESAAFDVQQTVVKKRGGGVMMVGR